MNKVPSRPIKKRNFWPLLISIATVIVVLDAFFLIGLHAPDLQENRLLARKPGMPVLAAEWESFTTRADAYITDNFPPRASMISYLNYARYLLGYSGSSKVIVGREGWMFYNDGSEMAKTAGIERLDANGLASWVAGFQQRIKYVENRGGKFYMLLAPVKEDIFPEFRPYWMPRERVATEFDDLVSKTRNMGIDRLVDPRPALLATKAEKKIWHKYDTHWTGLGAYVAYAALMDRISQDIPDLVPLPLSSFTPTPPGPARQPRDLSLMLGVSDFLKHGGVSFVTFPIHNPAQTIFLSDRKDWTAPQVICTGAAGARTLLWIRDSFGSEMLPMLKPHFSRIVMVHAQDGFFRQDLIEKFKPDVVVLEIIETGARHTMDLLPNLPM